MNIRLTIDRLVVEGMSLSPSDRAALEETLRESLTQALTEAALPRDVPEGRHARRERMDLVLPGRADGAALGARLGVALANHVWTGTVSPSTPNGGKP